MQSQNNQTGVAPHLNDEKQQQGNFVWLIVLVALILLMVFLSYPLFNYMWDPNAAQQTFSH
ncbi:MAG: hypothetical protein ACFCU1_06655 [Sumerlaeia bacterium]